jgi:hypothetical protein
MIPNAGGAEFYNSNVPVQFDSRLVLVFIELLKKIFI